MVELHIRYSPTVLLSFQSFIDMVVDFCQGTQSLVNVGRNARPFFLGDPSRQLQFVEV